MKRPEGFDGAAQPAPRTNRPARAPRARPVRPAPAPRRPPADRTAIDRPSRPRPPRAEFAAAERRRKREERAERRRFTQSARRRRIGWLSGALVLLMLVGLVLTAVFSPLLALRHVIVDGTERLDAAELSEAVGGQLGVPLALLDEGRIRSELGEFPLIRSYVTELVPPDTLLIHVVEREPVGVLATADGFQLLDPAGVLIATTPTRPDGYPVIELADGEDVTGPGYRSMAEVLLALPPSVLDRVTTIAAKTKDDVTLTLAGSSQRVIWGSADHSAEKAATLAVLIKRHKDDGPGEYIVSAPGVAVFNKD